MGKESGFAFSPFDSHAADHKIEFVPATRFIPRPLASYQFDLFDLFS